MKSRPNKVVQLLIRIAQWPLFLGMVSAAVSLSDSGNFQNLFKLLVDAYATLPTNPSGFPYKSTIKKPNITQELFRKIAQKIKTYLSLIAVLLCFYTTGLRHLPSVIESTKYIYKYKPIKSAAVLKTEGDSLFINNLAFVSSEITKETIAQMPTIIALATKNYALLHAYAITIAPTYTIIKIIKILSEETRPNQINAESFPSGHAVITFLGTTFLLFNLVARRKGLAIILMYMAGISVGFSRIYLNQHYLIDVFAGWLLGILCGMYMPTIATATLKFTSQTTFTTCNSLLAKLHKSSNNFNS